MKATLVFGLLFLIKLAASSNDLDTVNKNACVHGELTLNPADCGSFWQCVHGRNVIMICPIGLHWNNKTFICDKPEAAGCDDSVTRNECLNEEYTANPDNCSLYFQCVHGTYKVMPCPTGLHWNNKTKLCDWPHLANCSVTTKPIATTTESKQKENDLTTISNSITQIYETTSINKDITADQDGVTVSSVEVSEPTIGTNSELSTTIGIGKCKHEDLSSNPQDCGSFLQCVHGENIKRPCPTGLHWNHKIKRCDWPNEAECNFETTDNPTTMLAVTTDNLLTTTRGEPDTTTELTNTDNITADITHLTTSKNEETTDYMTTATSFSESIEITTRISDITTMKTTATYVYESSTIPTLIPSTSEDVTTDHQNLNTETTTMDVTRGETDGLDLTTDYTTATVEVISTTYSENAETTTVGQDIETETSFSTFETTEPDISTTVRIDVTSDQNDKCVHDQLRPNPESCASFLQCVHGTNIKMRCPQGLHWNDEKKICDWPSIANCTINENEYTTTTTYSTSEQTTSESEIVGTDITEAESTVSELTETTTMDVTRAETDGLDLTTDYTTATVEVMRTTYSENAETTTVGEDIETETSFSTFETTEPDISTTVRIDVTSDQNDKCVHDQLSPNPKSCASFLQCVHGTNKKMRCPQGLHWNDEKKICDWPSIANCTINENEYTTTTTYSTSEQTTSESEIVGTDITEAESTVTELTETTTLDVTRAETDGLDLTTDYTTATVEVIRTTYSENAETTTVGEDIETETSFSTFETTEPETQTNSTPTETTEYIPTTDYPKTTPPNATETTDANTDEEKITTESQDFTTDFETAETTTVPEDISTESSSSTDKDNLETESEISEPTTANISEVTEKPTETTEGIDITTEFTTLISSTAENTISQTTDSIYQTTEKDNINTETEISTTTELFSYTTNLATDTIATEETDTNNVESTTPQIESTTESEDKTTINAVECVHEELTPNPENCNSFLQCVHGVYKEMPCPKRLHWNNEKKICDWPENTSCATDAHQTTVATDTPPFTTDKDYSGTTFENTEEETATPEFTTVEDSEPTTNVIDSTTATSSSNTKVDEDLITTTTSKKCIHEELSSNPKNCSSFYQCVHGINKEMPCPEGLHWNNEAKICDWPSNSKCSDRTNSPTASSPTPTLQLTTLASSLNDKCSHGQYVADPKDCGKFRQCVHGTFYSMTCPSSLHWNDKNKTCDWPRNAKCSI